MSNGATKALVVIDVLLAAMRVARTFGIEYQLVASMQANAEAEGRDELNADERQALLARSQGAIDKL